MTMQNDIKYKGEKHLGPDHLSPYPLSRQSPSIDLVALAKEVAAADDLLTTQAAGKLQVVAEQIEILQSKARKILTETRRNQAMHRVDCGFKKRVGETYHLYSKMDESLFFSMISPEEWGKTLKERELTFHGSYRLERDRSWSCLCPGDKDAPILSGLEQVK